LQVLLLAEGLASVPVLVLVVVVSSRLLVEAAVAVLVAVWRKWFFRKPVSRAFTNLVRTGVVALGMWLVLVRRGWAAATEFHARDGAALAPAVLAPVRRVQRAQIDRAQVARIFWRQRWRGWVSARALVRAQRRVVALVALPLLLLAAAVVGDGRVRAATPPSAAARRRTLPLVLLLLRGSIHTAPNIQEFQLDFNHLYTL